MLIHQLEIHNFKSYNGLVRLGPFDEHFNCVVGPNGNGKSNIIDAVLFVFGFKSSKLRQDSLGALIHKSAFAAPDRAEVTVIFNDRGETLTVSRCIHRNNYSYYKFNGERINWADLRQVLITRRIDLNKNLFIILQGEVERLCELAPPKMVEYLEYVSGSDEFKESIEESEQLYLEKSIQKEEVRMALSVKNKVFRKIKEQAAAQVSWLLIKFRCLLMEHLFLKKTGIELDEKIESIELEAESVAEKIKEVQQDQKNQRLRIREVKVKYGELMTDIKKGEDFIQKIEDKKEKIKMKVKEIQRQAVYLTKDRDKKQQQISRYQKQVHEIEHISDQQQECLERFRDLTERIKKIGNIAELSTCYELEERYLSLEQEEKEISTKCRDERLKLAEDRAKLELYELKYKENHLKKVEYRKQVTSLENEEQELSEKIKTSEETLEQMQQQLKQAGSNRMVTTHDKVIKQIKSANQARLLCPQIQLHSLRQYVVIDNAYRNAVETILPQMDFIIVNTYKQAKTISEYLSQKKIGRMTFIIKELVLPMAKEIKIPTQAPPNTRFILDICHCEGSQIKSILKWALGSTLITNSLDTAMKVAYEDQQQYRVITLNGEFIDSSGTITKLTLKNAKDRDDSEFIGKKVDSINKQLQGNRQRIRLIQEQKDTASYHLSMIESEQRSFDGLDEVLLNQNEQQIKFNERKLVSLRQEIVEVDRRLTAAKKGLRIQSQQQYESSLSLIKEYKGSQDNVRKIENSNKILTSLKQKIGKGERQLRLIQQKMEEKMRDKSKVQMEEQKLDELKEKKNDQMRSILEAKLEFDKTLRELESELSHLAEQLEERGRQNSLKEKARQCKTRLRQWMSQKAELKGKLAQSLKGVSEMTSTVWRAVYLKTPQLLPHHNSEGESKSSDMTKDITEYGQLLSENKLYMGKQEYSFRNLMSTKEVSLLLSEKSFQSIDEIYTQPNDLLPEMDEVTLYFTSIESSDIKFSVNYEESKLKRIESQSEGRGAFSEELTEQYMAKKKEFEEHQESLKRTEEKLDNIKKRLVDLRSKRLDIFMTSFNEINHQLNSIYSMLTGGKAELEFVDSMNPFQGVEFSVRPVNKSWKRVNLLSGGEKTFTSLALIFGCEEIKKFPFYFMDEIDAALDYKNTTLLASYIKQKKGTQHIVISLRKNMYQESNRLIGVYKVQDQSRIFEMSMKEIMGEEQQALEIEQ